MVVGWMKTFAALLVLLMVAAGCGASDGATDAAAADEAAASESVEATGADDSSEDDGDGGEGTDGDGTGDSSDEDGDTTETSGDGDGTTWETYESPIQAFLGAPSFGPSEDDDEMYIEMERETQALIVECMSAQGFEYFPEDPERFADFEEHVIRLQEETGAALVLTAFPMGQCE